MQKRKRKKKGCGKKRGAMCPHEHVMRTHTKTSWMWENSTRSRLFFFVKLLLYGMVVHSGVMRNRWIVLWNSFVVRKIVTQQLWRRKFVMREHTNKKLRECRHALCVWVRVCACVGVSVKVYAWIWMDEGVCERAMKKTSTRVYRKRV